ncbi:MAG: tetratricopeptide repeat protein [Campylobacterota bacterium]|uniref:tetratricopeptide repeat protein n=1 Tax=Sulfurimonas sp. TaxID=2022749 RepID=UPI0026203115|nr:tetratricopeptide repeat protein [Sulfurimonas sp.]MDD5372260.1 tetratricopeptide repeat protein [Sulfurimonas sp.]MDD5400196.1 tetratricopeptide repeat protein [Sulfurimonas sp.]
MKTLTLANIYELQGLKEEALEIYKEILKKDPSNSDAKIAIRRLSGMRKKFLNVNTQMKEYFVKMEEEIEFNEFERWLLKLWS